MMEPVWKQIRNSLEKSLNPGAYTVWIKPLEGRVDGGKLTLVAPNEFVANWVRDRLLLVIREAACEIMGADPKITINARQERSTKPPVPAPVSSAQSEKRERTDQLGLPMVEPLSLIHI